MLWERIFTKADAPAVFADLVRAWKDDSNKVFVLRAGEPIENVRDFYEAHWPCLGTAEPLAEDAAISDRAAQRTGTYWFEVRYDPNFRDAYRHSANAQPLHTDGSYIPTFPNATLMVCVASAGDGGETIFVSADDVERVVAEADPELLDYLRTTPIPHARSGDARNEPVIREQDGKKLVNWNYYCVDRASVGDEIDRVESFQRILTSSPELRERLLEVKLRPGDAVTWKDDEVLHGRNGFAARHASERFLWKCAIDIGRFE